MKKIIKNKKVQNYIKFGLKIGFSVFAIYFIYNKIDIQQTKEYLLNANILLLLLGFVLYIVSKFISAFRLNNFFDAINLYITQRINLRLYYIGMFYNLFLPGGIGGDGYKVYLLNKHHKTKVKHLISAELLDRGSGMAALVSLALVSVLFSAAYQYFNGFEFVIYLALILIYPAFYVFVKLLFKLFTKKFVITNLLSFGVQGAQVIAVFFILLALGVEDGYVNYFVLFLVSSAASVIPISIGGFGLREMVFITGYQYLDVNRDIGVALSLLFFLMTAMSSFIGVFFTYKPDEGMAEPEQTDK